MKCFIVVVAALCLALTFVVGVNSEDAVDCSQYPGFVSNGEGGCNPVPPPPIDCSEYPGFVSNGEGGCISPVYTSGPAAPPPECSCLSLSGVISSCLPNGGCPE